MQTNAARNGGRAATYTTAWLILAVLLLFSIAAPLNQFKVPPIMPILMQALNLSVSGAGMLMSVFAITGLILALPSGLILQRTGFRTTGIIAGGSMVLGAALGALSQSNTLLLASRVIEGVGTGFMAVLAPALIAQWFAAEKRGTAMGIWSAWVPMGTGVMLIVAPRLAQSAGWPAVWWLGAAYAAVATLVYLLVVRPAPAPAGAASAADSQAAQPITASPLRNRNIWLLAGAFAAFGAAGVGLNTYMPTFLATVRGVPLGQAALLAGIPTLVTIISAPGGGVVSDRVRSRKKPYLVGFALTIVLLPLTGVVSVSALVVLQVIIGLALGLIPTNVFSAAVEAAGDERLGGLAMAVIMVGQNAGMLIGPIIFGALAEGPGWPAAFASLAVMSACGLLCGWLARVR